MADNEKLQALSRLVAIARQDTGQSGRVANFLLSWWNAASCGGFDMTDLWMVDRSISDDILVVMSLIRDSNEYPTAYGLGDVFEELVSSWRPLLAEA